MLLNFGEPENPTLDNVTTFLELIFQANAPLEGNATKPSRGSRSLEMAAVRAPELVQVYREIGGSPLNLQAREQAVALEEELQQRGREATRNRFRAVEGVDDMVDEEHSEFVGYDRLRADARRRRGARPRSPRASTT